MGSIEYDKLYELQDSVLRIVFATEKEFYLTGGTCLSRFYKAKRYSDDLDFFTNECLKTKNIPCTKTVSIGGTKVFTS